jgi:hypothetical protein
MANNNTSDYKIILIDSSNVFYTNNNTNNFDFYINFNEPLKDVYKIKILYDAISFTTSKLHTNADLVDNLDNIYINLNDYDRVRSYLINPTQNTITNLQYFDSIMIDTNKVKAINQIDETTMFNDFNENEGDYEFHHTVEAEEFPRIAARFGLNPKDPILRIVQQITDMGKGQELERALTKQEIKNELWTWLNTP